MQLPWISERGVAQDLVPFLSVGSLVLSSPGLNSPGGEVTAFLQGDQTRAWSILHLRSYSQGSDAFNVSS